MNAYEALAASYDALTYDIAYDETLEFMESILQKLGKTPETVLDLACGTGSMSIRLARRGYRVTGVDISQEMLTAAYGKAMELEGERPLFVCQSMQELELPEPVDLTVCCLDSLNYLTDPADCRETFRRVFESLQPGGVFLFDINSSAKLRGLDGQVFLDETDDVFCVWRAEYSKRRRICTYGMDIFERDGQNWRRGEELHEEFAYTPEELTLFLQEAGFSRIRQYGNLKLRPPKQGEERIFFVARKDL